MLSISTCCLIMASTMHPRTFIVCSSNSKPWKLPHLVVSTFPLKHFGIIEWSQLLGIYSLFIRLIISVITSSIASLPALIISMTIPDRPYVLPFIFSTASVTISLVIFTAGPSTEGSVYNEPSSQSSSKFNSCSYRVFAGPYLMTLYIIFSIHLNFPICSRCSLKAIVHRKKQWIVLPLLEKVSFLKKMLFLIIVHACQGCKQRPVNGNYWSYLHYHRSFC